MRLATIGRQAFLSGGVALAVLALSGLGSGCASLPVAGPSFEGEVRPDAPPEYDVLVFHDHLSEGRTDLALEALERAVAKDPESAYLHRLSADLLARDNQLDRAVHHAKRALELDPDDTPVRDLLAQIYRVQRDVDGASALLLDDSGEPSNLESARLLYQMYVEVENLDEAERMARWMTEAEPGESSGWIVLATLHHQREQRELAEQAMRRALSLDPDDLRLYATLARWKREAGDAEGAIELYREMLEQAPDHHGTLRALAESQIGDEDLEGAIETLERVAEGYPNDIDSLKRLGFLLYEARRFDDAIARFEAVLARAPREYEAAFFRGVALRRVGRDEEAVAVFERIPAHHEYYPQARTQLAAIRERRGDYAGALEDIEAAISTSSTRELELYSATLRSKTGDFEGAVSYLEGLLEQAPEDDELLYSLGVVHEESGKTEQAIALMKRAIAINPDNADALNFIGYTWAERGENLEQAEEFIIRALNLRPDNGFIVDSLGWLYYMRARPLIEAGNLAKGREWVDKALQELRRASELTGGDPVISEHMGDVYLLIDERRRALDKFEEAALMGPRTDEQPELHEKLETLRRELE